MFHKFYNRIEMNAELMTITPIHIGMGQESYQPSSVKAPLLKNAFGQPYIPGSSIRGVLRSFIESIQSKDCYLGEACVGEFGDGAARKDHRQKLMDLGCKDVDYCAAQDMIAKSCMACRLFGSKIVAGKVKISDAMAENTQQVKTEIRKGNAIDRDTHTAVDKALFDIETIPSGTPLKIVITAENLTEEETKVFAQMMRYFGEGNLLVGGSRRSGLGKVCLQTLKLKVIRREPGSFPIEKNESIDEISEFPQILDGLLQDSFPDEPEEVTECSKK